MAVSLGLDGVDFDIELTPGNNKPFHDGSIQQFLVEATRTARSVLGWDRLISHAPQGPYLGNWAGSTLGYTDLMNPLSNNFIQGLTK